jgi:hypothetical protein
MQTEFWWRNLLWNVYFQDWKNCDSIADGLWGKSFDAEQWINWLSTVPNGRFSNQECCGVEHLISAIAVLVTVVYRGYENGTPLENTVYMSTML